MDQTIIVAARYEKFRETAEKLFLSQHRITTLIRRQG